MNREFELGGDGTDPRVESESCVDGRSSENRVDSASVHLIGPSDNSTVVQGVESVGGSVAEGSMDSVSPEEIVSDVNNRTDGDSNKFGVSESHGEVFSGRNNDSVKHAKREQQKGKKKKESKSKEPILPTYDSMISMFDDFAAHGSVSTVVRPSMESAPGHAFEVGDMVWGKVKSHPWWPGHVYSEELATPSVRRLKREGLLLVAFFGDSSYGWFDPSQLIPFDSNFVEKSNQTNSKTFVKAVEEAMDEVSRRSALGLSCMCRSKRNFRETGVQGFFAVDVVDYEPGAVYSIEAIEKARDSFQPNLALDFIRQLALQPTGGDRASIDFIKNKANVMSYRRAVYEEFDDTYAQAFGYQSDRPSPGSVQELPPGRTSSKAPLSGRQVFADTSGKGKSSAKPNKLKDHSKKDKYLFKRREESKEVKVPKKEKGKVALVGDVKDSMATADDYVLQKRVLGTHEQTGTAIANDELASKDATPTGASMEDTPIVLEFSDPSSQTITTKVESPIISSAGEIGRSGNDDEKTMVPQMEHINESSDLVDDKSSSDGKDGTPSSVPRKIVAKQKEDNVPKKPKVSKRPVSEMGSGKSVLPEKKKKRKKEVLTSDGKEGVQVSAQKPVPIEDVNRSDSKATTCSSSHETMSGAGSNEAELSGILGDLHSLAIDPFHAIDRGLAVKARQVFLRFRSVVFQKSLNLAAAAAAAAEDDGNNDNTHSTKSPAITENGLGKSQARPTDDPTKGGRKRGPSDRQEEIAKRKKKKVGDIRNLTKEKKVIKKIDEPAAREAVVVHASKKPGPEFKNTEQRVAPEPTMLVMRFSPGGSLPSMNELKATFARFGPMDHSATRIYWNTFTCRLVYRHKANAQAAYKFVVGSSNLFGNSDIKCSLKEVGVESEPSLRVPKEDEDRPAVAMVPVPGMSGLQLKSCLKKSGGEEAAGSGGKGMPRVKFMLGGDESVKKVEEKNGSGSGSSYGDGIGGASSLSSSSSFSSSSSSHATMDFNSKNFHKAVLHPPPLLPLPISSTAVTSSISTAQFTRPPPPKPNSSMHYGTALAPPPPPPHSLNYGSNMAVPPPQTQTQTPPPSLVALPENLQRPNPKVDITQQMLRLLTKCNDVVSNVTNMLGYVPYHPL